MDAPPVSILMPAYNAGRFLRDAVESMLGQTFREFELILVDDGSTDGTARVLDGFQDPRIVRLRNERNLGLVATLNRALSQARGEWVARMDADDLSTPDRLEKQMAFLAARPGVDVLGCRMQEMDEQGRFLHVFFAPEEHEAILWVGLFECSIAHATTVMRRQVLEAAGGYRPDFAHVEDVDLWRRLMGHARFANLPDVLYRRRWHGASVCSTQTEWQSRQGQAIRRSMWSELVQRDIPPDTYARFDAARYPVLEGGEMRELLEWLLRLYDGFVGRFAPSGRALEHIHADLALRAMGISQRNGYVHPAALRHPWKRLIPAPLKRLAKRITRTP